MFTIVVVGGFLLIAALLGLAFWCAYRVGRADGYETRIADEAQQRASERAAARKSPRHAPTEPRRAPERTSLVKSPDRITWGRDEAAGGPVELTPDLATRRAAVSVILPEPGSYRPQPGRDSGAGTIALPRVQLKDASTGEMRAVTDRFIEEHCS